MFEVSLFLRLIKGISGMIPLPTEIERVEHDLIDRKITGREASEIVFRVRRKLGPPWHWKEWKIGRAKMYDICDAVIPEMRDCCPICESLSIQYRKGAATWICNSKSGGGYCGHVFVEPAKKAALTAVQKKAIRKDKYQAYRDVVLNREHDVVRQAMLDWIKDWRRYLTLKDTKTLCKSCAYIEDMMND